MARQVLSRESDRRQTLLNSERVAAMSRGDSPIVTIEHISIDKLRADPANPRRISDAELEALTRSIDEFGLVDPIIARLEDKTVIGGHQRLVAARRLGLETVPVVFVDLSAEKARVLNLALNKISGQWDEELLARLLSDLAPVEGVDLTLSGFAEDELAKLLKSLDSRERRQRSESFDLDEALESARRSTRSKPGDYRLADGREFKSPSAAGSAIMGGVACNGWRFFSLATDAAEAPAKPAAKKAAKRAPKQAAKTPEPEPTPETPADSDEA